MPPNVCSFSVGRVSEPLTMSLNLCYFRVGRVSEKYNNVWISIRSLVNELWYNNESLESGALRLNFFYFRFGRVSGPLALQPPPPCSGRTALRTRSQLMDEPGWCVFNSKLIGQYTYRILSTVASLFLFCTVKIQSVQNPPRGQWAKIGPNIMLGEKNEWKGMKKYGGKCIFFPPIGQKCAFFSPNWLKINKITKKA